MVLARFEDKIKKLKAKIAEEEREQELKEITNARKHKQTRHIIDAVVEVGEDYLTEDQARLSYHEKRKLQRSRAFDNAVEKALPILDTLQDFHEKAKNTSLRWGLLRRMSLIVWEEVSCVELGLRRKTFNESKNALFPCFGQWCWLCNRTPAIHRHHVILLKHGGPELDAQNVVLLCKKCHESIHPWMYYTSLNDLELNRIIVAFQKAKERRLSRTQVELEMSSILDSIFSPVLEEVVKNN